MYGFYLPTCKVTKHRKSQRNRTYVSILFHIKEFTLNTSIQLLLYLINVYNIVVLQLILKYSISWRK